MPPNTCSDAKKTRKQKHQNGNYLRSNNDALYNLELLSLHNVVLRRRRQARPDDRLDERSRLPTNRRVVVCLRSTSNNPVRARIRSPKIYVPLSRTGLPVNGHSRRSEVKPFRLKNKTVLLKTLSSRRFIVETKRCPFRAPFRIREHQIWLHATMPRNIFD